MSLSEGKGVASDVRYFHVVIVMPIADYKLSRIISWAVVLTEKWMNLVSGMTNHLGPLVGLYAL